MTCQNSKRRYKENMGTKHCKVYSKAELDKIIDWANRLFKSFDLDWQLRPGEDESFEIGISQQNHFDVLFSVFNDEVIEKEDWGDSGIKVYNKEGYSLIIYINHPGNYMNPPETEDKEIGFYTDLPQAILAAVENELQEMLRCWHENIIWDLKPED